MASSFCQVMYVAGLCASIHCLPSCKPTSRGSPHPPSMKGTPTFQLSSLNTNFAFRLYRRLVLQNQAQNIIFSPISVSISLAMLSLGARSATKVQILQSLGFNITHAPEPDIHRGFQHLVHSLNAHSKAPSLKMGNALFIKKGLQLQKNFLDRVKRLYESQVFSVDFSNTTTARARINNYMARETRGKVVDVIQDLDSQATMILVNHVFFKAKWTQPFSPANKKKRFPFWLDKGKTVLVPMMHQTDSFAFGVDPELDCSVLQMDYLGDTKAIFVMPGKGKLRQLEQALSTRTLRRWRHSLRKRWMEVFMPKFSISASYDLKAILLKMDIHDAFNNNADFSGITDRDFLKISKAVHKAALAVSEEGTEASAATTTKFIVRSKDAPSQLVILFNRPFILIIVDESLNSVLFMGKVVNPTKA